jgi:hypothetical protein
VCEPPSIDDSCVSFVASTPRGRSFSFAARAARAARAVAAATASARAETVSSSSDQSLSVDAERTLASSSDSVASSPDSVASSSPRSPALARARRESRTPNRGGAAKRSRRVRVADGARSVDVRVFRLKRVPAEPEEQQHDPRLDVGHVHVRPRRRLEAPDQHLERALLFELRVYAETLAQGVHLIAHRPRIWVGKRVVPRVVQAVVVRDLEVFLARLDADDALHHLREQRVDLIRAPRGERRRHGADVARVRPTLRVHFQTIEKTVAGDGRRAWSLDSLKASLKHKKRTPGSKNALKPFGFAGQPVISRSRPRELRICVGFFRHRPFSVRYIRRRRASEASSARRRPARGSRERRRGTRPALTRAWSRRILRTARAGP